TSENLQESNLSQGYNFIFDTYQNRNEINQNLSNAPSSTQSFSNNQTINFFNENNCALSNNSFNETVTINYQSNNSLSIIPSNYGFWNPSQQLCKLLVEFN